MAHRILFSPWVDMIPLQISGMGLCYTFAEFISRREYTSTYPTRCWSAAGWMTDIGVAWKNCGSI